MYASIAWTEGTMAIAASSAKRGKNFYLTCDFPLIRWKLLAFCNMPRPQTPCQARSGGERFECECECECEGEGATKTSKQRPTIPKLRLEFGDRLLTCVPALAMGEQCENNEGKWEKKIFSFFSVSLLVKLLFVVMLAGLAKLFQLHSKKIKIKIE